MIDQLLVEPGTEARLRERSADATFGLDKAHGKKQLADLHERLDVLQQRLYAEGTRSLLLVLQGMITDEGTTIVKIFLNVSKEEQRTRLIRSRRRLSRASRTSSSSSPARSCRLAVAVPGVPE